MTQFITKMFYITQKKFSQNTFCILIFLILYVLNKLWKIYTLIKLILKYLRSENLVPVSWKICQSYNESLLCSCENNFASKMSNILRTSFD